jgi:hypothetical protein
MKHLVVALVFLAACQAASPPPPRWKNYTPADWWREVVVHCATNEWGDRDSVSIESRIRCVERARADYYARQDGQPTSIDVFGDYLQRRMKGDSSSPRPDLDRWTDSVLAKHAQGPTTSSTNCPPADALARAPGVAPRRRDYNEAQVPSELREIKARLDKLEAQRAP